MAMGPPVGAMIGDDGASRLHPGRITLLRNSPGHRDDDGVNELANFNGAAEIVNLEILEAAFRNQWDSGFMAFVTESTIRVNPFCPAMQWRLSGRFPL